MAKEIISKCGVSVKGKAMKLVALCGGAVRFREGREMAAWAGHPTADLAFNVRMQPWDLAQATALLVCRIWQGQENPVVWRDEVSEVVNAGGRNYRLSPEAGPNGSGWFCGSDTGTLHLPGRGRVTLIGEALAATNTAWLYPYDALELAAWELDENNEDDEDESEEEKVQQATKRPPERTITINGDVYRITTSAGDVIDASGDRCIVLIRPGQIIIDERAPLDWIAQAIANAVVLLRSDEEDTEAEKAWLRAQRDAEQRPGPTRPRLDAGRPERLEEQENRRFADDFGAFVAKVMGAGAGGGAQDSDR